MANGNMSYDIEVRSVCWCLALTRLISHAVQQFTNLKELDSEWDDDDIDVSNRINNLHISSEPLGYVSKGNCDHGTEIFWQIANHR